MVGSTQQRRPQDAIGIPEMIDALLLFDEPILNSRYRALLARHPDDPMRTRLVELPLLVLESERQGRLAAAMWHELGPLALDPEFIERGELSLLEAFLSLAENQLRMIAFMARNAPTARVRGQFHEMARLHRSIAQTLRSGLSTITNGAPLAAHTALRSVQEEGSEVGDLRERLEAAIVSSREAGKAVRSVRISYVALRHLRDQGCFRGGETTVLGVPVMIDQSWEASAFSLEGYDVVPLEEIISEMREENDQPA